MSIGNALDIEIGAKTTVFSMKKTPELRFHTTFHPLVYEVNSRVLLNELDRMLNKQITLGDIPDDILDEWASLGFDAIWMMGVWTTGRVGLDIARGHDALRREYQKVLPDLSDDDVVGSPYAVKAYTVPQHLGGNEGLLKLRRRLRQRSVALILDFVPNHTARDHPWVSRHPEYYIKGREGDDTRQPEFYFKAKTREGHTVLAFGRDPNYPGWTDTAQLNIRYPATRAALVAALKKISALCDGVRCDMAMLLLSDVFERSWGAFPAGDEPTVGEFWSEAIRTVRENEPLFKFIAEAYWDREWHLQQLGFDFTYDKKLYERLSHEGASSVSDHLKAEAEYQRRSVRFIENHDEERSAKAFSSDSWHFAAAVVMSCVPGMALFHEGQLTGSRAKVPVQLGRRPAEDPSAPIRSFYHRLLSIISDPVFRHGQWSLLQVKPAWHDNYSWTNFLAFWWFDKNHGARLVVVNYAPLNGQCYIEIKGESVEGTSLEFRDLLGTASYVRERSTLTSRGMYFDLPGYGLHIFEVRPHKQSI